jgi:hypothetical protein
VNEALADRYVEIVKASVAGVTHDPVYAISPWNFGRRRERWPGTAGRSLVAALARISGRNLALVEQCDEQEDYGGVWLLAGETMVGKRRLDHLQECVERVLADGVPGDLIEAGVWRGGTAIFMRALLAAHGVTDRTVWLADSFAGLPAPDTARYPADRGLDLHTYPELAVPLEHVTRAFDRYGLRDEQVRFLEGWFEETLPTLRGHRWALVRIDADLYQSTTEALENLYPSLEPGGFLIVDDYGVIEPCRRAVDEFRAGAGVTDPLERIDASAVFWRRT